MILRRKGSYLLHPLVVVSFKVKWLLLEIFLQRIYQYFRTCSRYFFFIL